MASLQFNSTSLDSVVKDLRKICSLGLLNIKIKNFKELQRRGLVIDNSLAGARHELKLIKDCDRKLADLSQTIM